MAALLAEADIRFFLALFILIEGLFASPVYLLLLQRRVPEARIACLRSDIDGSGDYGSIGARRNANYLRNFGDPGDAATRSTSSRERMPQCEAWHAVSTRPPHGVPPDDSTL